MIYLRIIAILTLLISTVSASEPELDSALLLEGAAMIHIFRGKGSGSVEYDLQLSNRNLCRVKENCKESVKVTKLGDQKIWARIDQPMELPINLEAGKHYYIKCGVGKGTYSGYPIMELQTSESASYEFITFQRSFKEDKILLKDGEIIHCFITHEDDSKIYFTMILGGNKTQTSIDKDRVVATKKGK